jgi:hypothetical protein
MSSSIYISGSLSLPYEVTSLKTEPSISIVPACQVDVILENVEIGSVVRELFKPGVTFYIRREAEKCIKAIGQWHCWIYWPLRVGS